MFPSRAGHVEPGLNLGGPPPKAKYVLATDSVPVARAKGEKNPFKGSEKQPETVHLHSGWRTMPLLSSRGMSDSVPIG